MAGLVYLLLQQGVRLVESGVEGVVIVLAGGSQFALANKQSELVFNFKAFSPFPENHLLALAKVQPINHVAARSNHTLEIHGVSDGATCGPVHL